MAMEVGAPGGDRRVTLQVRTSRKSPRLLWATSAGWLFELGGLWFAAKNIFHKTRFQPTQSPNSGDPGQFWAPLRQKPVRPASMPHSIHLCGKEVNETLHMFTAMHSEVHGGFSFHLLPLSLTLENQ